ncbi:kinase-like protein [Heliocybe sulcata]|uniref:Kinase-like protein n=1 Tax=Heliocybe sulcata TaxID=5364 RepID=A0A5C3N1Q0_9AGAM|nr:kinase-like protein [Heliocybe sulcata]
MQVPSEVLRLALTSSGSSALVAGHGTAFAQDSYVDLYSIADPSGHHSSVAVKILRPRFSETLSGIVNMQLTQTIGRVDLLHPYLCPTSLLQAPDRPCLLLLTPYFKNGNILTFVRNNPTVDIMNLVIQAARALEYLHERDMTHGNIKATNLLIDDSGAVYLSDVQVNAVLRRIDVVRSGRVRLPGNLGYKPPEEIEPPVQAPDVYCTKPGDVYALAVLICELFARESYDPANRSIQQWAQSHASFLQNTATMNVPPPLWDLLLSCWDLDPTRRPSASQVRRRLEGM